MSNSRDARERQKKIEIAVAYVLAVLIVGVLLRQSPRLSLLLPLALPLGLFDKNPKRFFVAWFPVALIVVAYDLMRGAIDADAAYVNFTLLPRIEAALFGGQPVLWLQANALPFLSNPLGIFPTLIYFAHFVVPVVLLYALWKHAKHDFVAAATSLVILSFAGYVTFLVFPAAPPWMAGENGTLPPVRHVVIEHLTMFYRLVPTFEVAASYSEMTANQVAPFPSLHAGYAFLIACWSVVFFQRHRWLGPTYCVFASFVIVLYGEHYVVDVLGGWVYAVASFVVASWLARRPGARRLSWYLAEDSSDGGWAR